MEALVADYLARFDAAIAAEESTGQADSAIRAYIDQFRSERRGGTPPPAGLLAALAEDPGMLDPVRRHEGDFLARIQANASDPDMATLTFLAIHGIRAMELLNTQVLDHGQEEALLDWVRRRLGEPD